MTKQLNAIEAREIADKKQSGTYVFVNDILLLIAIEADKGKYYLQIPHKIPESAIEDLEQLGYKITTTAICHVLISW